MSTSMQQQLEKMQGRQNYHNLWHTELMKTIQADPVYCCFALWCPPCASYLLRKRALYDDMSRYLCCGGYMPCSGKCGERKCPQFCLCTEVCCCFSNSVQSTRFLLQDEFNIQTTKCDNCIIAFMFCLSQIACIFSIIALIVGSEELNEASHILSCLANIVHSSVCACMQTQHKIEMDKRDGLFGTIGPMVVPPVQQMSRLDGTLPPTVGYPPPAYGQPYPPPPTAPPPQQGYSGQYPPPPQQGYSGQYPPPPQQGYSGQYPPPGSYPPAQGYPPAQYPPPPSYPPPGHSAY